MHTTTSLRGVSVIAFTGAAIRLLDGKDAIVGTVDLQPGVHDLTAYQPLCDSGVVELKAMLIVKSPHGRLQVIHTEDRFETAANPTYQPSAAERAKAVLVGMVNKAVRATHEKAEKARRKEREHRDVPVIETTAPVEVEPVTPPVTPPKKEEKKDGPTE